MNGKYVDINDDEGRLLSTREHSDNVHRATKCIDLNSFAAYLTALHDKEEDLAKQIAEDEHDEDAECVDQGQRLKRPDLSSLPRDIEKEKGFIAAMKSLSSPVYYAEQYQREMVKQVNPTCDDEDYLYIHRLCDTEETSIEGMTLTMANIQEEIGILDPQSNDNFSLNENALKRTVFMYGDALSVMPFPGQ